MEVREVYPINGQGRFSARLANLPEIELPDWPPYLPMLEQVPALKLGREIAIREAGRHLKKLLSLKIWSPYPILSYCLGNAETEGNCIHVRYFLFPLASPGQQNHAVAQVVYETQIGEPNGEIPKIWVDALRENELSDENRRHIAAAISGLKT